MPLLSARLSYAQRSGGGLHWRRQRRHHIDVKSYSKIGGALIYFTDVTGNTGPDVNLVWRATTRLDNKTLDWLTNQ